jgi:hypothetical protein
MCGSSRWDQVRLHATNGRIKAAAKKFTTIPIGPQLQARYRNPQSAQDMHYLHQKTQEVLATLEDIGQIPVIEDIVMGLDFLTPVMDGAIKENDIALMVSLDGAQLYEHKDSDCWIYVWIIVNLSPNKRYRKLNVLPGGFFPGPKKPKHLDSLLCVRFHHLAALQNEGLMIWDADRDITFRCDPYLLFPTADGPGLVYWDGMVGHSGKNGCRVYCGLLGHRKSQGHTYYPVLLTPRDHCVAGSNHVDVDVFHLPFGSSAAYAENLKYLMTSPNQTQYNQHKTEMGITKVPLILGLSRLHSLGVPYCMTTDIMHLASNLSDLLISLWNASATCDPTDNLNDWHWAVFRDKQTWERYGQSVHEAGKYLPCSFGRRPRNITEKISTGYKTWEFQLHTFGLGSILLYDILPDRYFQNYCKLVRGFQILCQHYISSDDLIAAHGLLCHWEREFEDIYYCLREDRVQFVRPCMHQVNHLVIETIRKGPPICYAQWTMEWTIGNLGQEIQQALNPYANLAQEGVRRCRVNSLLAAMPELAPPPKNLPSTAEDLGNGYVFLHKRDHYHYTPQSTAEICALQTFLGPVHPIPLIRRWARLKLPNGQIAHSVWKEGSMDTNKTRVSRNIGICCIIFSIAYTVAHCTSLPCSMFLLILALVQRCGSVKYSISLNLPLTAKTIHIITTMLPSSSHTRNPDWTFSILPHRRLQHAHSRARFQ